MWLPKYHLNNVLHLVFFIPWEVMKVEIRPLRAGRAFFFYLVVVEIPMSHLWFRGKQNIFDRLEWKQVKWFTATSHFVCKARIARNTMLHRTKPLFIYFSIRAMCEIIETCRLRLNLVWSRLYPRSIDFGVLIKYESFMRRKFWYVFDTAA